MKPCPVTALPDGRNSEDYLCSLDWNGHRWAWEFLRRNPLFQLKCDAIEVARTKKAINELKSEFGLVRYKHYREDYGDALKHRPKFVTGDVVCWPRVTEKIYKKIESSLPKGLKEGQVLIRFDLTKFASIGPGSIRAMLDSTEDFLKRAADIWVRSRSEAVDTRRVKDDLIVLLRTLDIERTAGETLSSLDKLLMVDADVRQDYESEDGTDDPAKIYGRRMASAAHYRDHKYLHLATSDELPAFAKALKETAKVNMRECGESGLV